MPIKRFLAIFCATIIVCVIICVLAFTSFNYMEDDTAVNWTMRYFALTIIMLTAPACYFIYKKFLRQHEMKEYNSKLWTGLRTAFRTLIFTVGITMIFTATTLSIIILTNAYLGSGRTIHLNATVVDYYTTKSKGRHSHYINIKDPQLDRIVKLKVDRPYAVGGAFNKTMQVGHWGLLYAND